MLFSAIMAFGVISYLSVVTREIPQQAKRIDRNRAMEIADAGLEHALWYINERLDVEGRTWWQEVCESYEEGVQTDDYEVGSPEYMFEEQEHYEVDIDHLTDTLSGLPTFFVRATGYITRDLPNGEQIETKKTMAVMTRPEGFADYARFVSDGNLSYGANAVLDGNVHTNRSLYCNGYPVTFRRKVTVGQSVVNQGNGIFYDELKTGVPTVELDSTMISSYIAPALSGGIYLDNHPEYYNAADDRYYIDLGTLVYPTGFNGIVYCSKDIKIHGTPTRPVTFVSNDDIYITDHIHQGYDPRHVVGLIAKDMLYLDTSTPNNLEVYAALMSTGNTWKALGTYASKSGLTIKGSIVTKYGGDANAYHGGVRNYIYDRRLLYYVPPSFPDFPGGSYMLIAWLEAPGESDWQSADIQLPDLQGLGYIY
jgi:hypothetical protein